MLYLAHMVIRKNKIGGRGHAKMFVDVFFGKSKDSEPGNLGGKQRLEIYKS